VAGWQIESQQGLQVGHSIHVSNVPLAFSFDYALFFSQTM